MTVEKELLEKLDKITWKYHIDLEPHNQYIGYLDDGEKISITRSYNDEGNCFELRYGDRRPVFNLEENPDFQKIFIDAVIRVDRGLSYLVNRITNILDIFDVRKIGSQYYGCPDEYTSEAIWIIETAFERGLRKVDYAFIDECWMKWFGDTEKAVKEHKEDALRSVDLINSAFRIYFTTYENNKDLFDYLIGNVDRIEWEKDPDPESGENACIGILDGFRFQMDSYAEDQVSVSVLESGNYFYREGLNLDASIREYHDVLYDAARRSLKTDYVELSSKRRGKKDAKGKRACLSVD